MIGEADRDFLRALVKREGASAVVRAAVDTAPVALTEAEFDAIATLIDLELGTRESDRIEAWRHLETAGAKLAAAPDLATALRNLLTDIENTHVPTHIAETSQGISGAIDEANEALLAAGYEPVEVTWRDG